MQLKANIKKLQNLPSSPLGKPLNAVRWFGGRSPISPRYIELCLTYKCNLSCAFCYQDQSRRVRSHDLSLADIEKIEANIARSFRWKPTIYLFGGEPTIVRDFIEIFRYFSERGYKLAMTTNGARISTHHEEIGTNRNLRNLMMSVNTPDYEAVRTNVRTLQEHMPSYSISLNCPVDVPMQHGTTMDAIIREFDDLDIQHINFQHSQTVFLHEYEHDVSEIQRQVAEVRAQSYGVPVMFFPPIKDADIPRYYTDASFPAADKKCVLPWFDMFIRPNGDVTPCDEVDEIVGNAFDEELDAIWNGPKLTTFRRDIQQKGNSTEFCTRCCHRQYY